jgi:hypothetical protein
MSKIRYFHLKYFDEYKKNLIRNKADFEIEKTTYSRKITMQDRKLIFNEDGSQDIQVLRLINNVRADAEHYVKHGGMVGNSYISFYDLYNRPPKGVSMKIDIKSAYWVYALKRGIITNKTNTLYENIYEGLSEREAKEKRTKALGSLATRKRILTYIKGKPDYDNEEIFSHPAREIYLDICRGIDDLMKSCVYNTEGAFYHYWDCIFADKLHSKNIIEFFKDNKYDVGVTETMIVADRVGDSRVLTCLKDDITYCVRSEQGHLLDDVSDWGKNYDYKEPVTIMSLG